MSTVSSYQKNSLGRDATSGGNPTALNDASPRNNRIIVRVLLAIVVLTSALVLFRGGESQEGFETVVSGLSSIFDNVPGGMMGSSHKKQKKPATFRGLTIQGYPPLSVQKEYWEDLQKIDWKEVEADMTALLTDSQECESLFSCCTVLCMDYWYSH